MESDIAEAKREYVLEFVKNMAAIRNSFAQKMRNFD